MSDSNYISIRVSTLRGDLQIPFDAHVKIGEKQILYCRKGDHFEGERLARLKSKKLQMMYIKSSDKSLYDEYISENIRNAYSKNTSKPILLRAEIVQGIQQAIAEDLMTEPDNHAFYRLAFQGAEQFIDFILEQPLAFRALQSIPNEESSISHHGVSVSAIATGLAYTMGFHKKRAMEIPSLVIGSMIHDIEEFRQGVSFNMVPEEMNEAEKYHFNQHTQVGFNIIKDISFYDKLIKDILLKHEEHLDGTGSPNGLTEKDIDPLVFCVAVANAYDRYVQIKKLKPKEALKKMLIEKMGIYPLDMLQALQSTLKTLKVIA